MRIFSDSHAPRAPSVRKRAFRARYGNPIFTLARKLAYKHQACYDFVHVLVTKA
jgi:hypothetical protein